MYLSTCGDATSCETYATACNADPDCPESDAGSSADGGVGDGECPTGTTPCPTFESCDGCLGCIEHCEGTCDATTPPECLPSCEGKSCGSDGCGGLCGAACDTGETCSVDSDCGGNLICDTTDAANPVCRSEACRSTDPSVNPCLDPVNAGRSTECGVCDPCAGGCGPGEPPTGRLLVDFTDSNQVDFTRTSAATYLTVQHGQVRLKTAQADTLRWGDRGDGHGAVPLLEGSRTNLHPHSEAFDQYRRKPRGNRDSLGRPGSGQAVPHQLRANHDRDRYS